MMSPIVKKISSEDRRENSTAWESVYDTKALTMSASLIDGAQIERRWSGISDATHMKQVLPEPPEPLVAAVSQPDFRVGRGGSGPLGPGALEVEG